MSFDCFIDFCRYNASGDNSRGQRQPNRNYHNTDVSKNDEVFKRKHETKTVFSRYVVISYT